MQFRARLAAVSGVASKSVDKPSTINVKLEPLQLDQPDWLFERLGSFVIIDITDPAATATPLERAIDDMFASDVPR